MSVTVMRYGNERIKMTSEFEYKVYEKYGGVFSKGKKTRFKRLNIVLTLYP